MTGIYKEYWKEAKLLLGKSCGLVYVLIILKIFLLGDWRQVFSNKRIPWCQEMAHDRLISLCCCWAVAPRGPGRNSSPGELKGGSAMSCPDALISPHRNWEAEESKWLAFWVINWNHFQGFTMQTQLTLGQHLIIQTLTANMNSVAEENLNDLTFIQVRGRPNIHVSKGVRLSLRESLSWEVSRGPGIHDPQGLLAVKKGSRSTGSGLLSPFLFSVNVIYHEESPESSGWPVCESLWWHPSAVSQ